MSVQVDVKALLESGAHFGHKTSRWHPKMAPYIHSKRGDSHIIDLIQTKDCLDEALTEISKVVASGKQVLLVGTKRQARETVRQTAEATGQPFVTHRWLGGMLTNHKTMNTRVKRLKSLEEKMESGELAGRYNKLEVQRFQEEIDQLNEMFGGIKDMNGLPGAVFVTDAIHNGLAIEEANRLNIPVIAIVDTNVDPSDIKFPVPANDDAIKSVALITKYVGEAISQGKNKQKAPAKAPEKKEEKPKAKKEEQPKKEDKKGE